MEEIPLYSRPLYGKGGTNFEADADGQGDAACMGV